MIVVIEDCRDHTRPGCTWRYPFDLQALAASYKHRLSYPLLHIRVSVLVAISSELLHNNGGSHFGVT